MIFDQIKEIYIEIDPLKENQLIQSFNDHIEQSNQKFQENHNIQNYEKKQQINEILFSKFQELLSNIDIRLSSIFSELKNLNQDQSINKLKISQNYIQDCIIKSEQSLLQVEINSKNQNLEETFKYKYNQDFSEFINDEKNIHYNYNNLQQSQQESYQSNFKFKAIPLKKLKDIINEIYQSKQQFDLKQEKYKQPPETMEQHMYTYLNKKYGLKNLVIEWASTIVNGIQIYQQEDIEVKVFGKIIANRCDEEFRVVLIQVKKSIQELLNIYYKNKFQYKPNQEIKKIVQDKVKNSIGLEECQDIIQNMYNPQDAEFLINQIYSQSQQVENDFHENKSREEINSSKMQKLKRIIKFSIFQEIILQFLFQQHQNFLSNFINIFNNYDFNFDGILTESEFRQMIQFMKINEDNIEQYLQNLDPYIHDKIIFSKCIKLFSESKIQQGDNTLTILQYLSQQR